MFDWLLRIAIPKFGPMVARYVAAAVVGLVVASLQHFKIVLDPDTLNELTAGATGLLLAVIVAAGRAKSKDTEHSEVGKAVNEAAKANGVPVNDVISAAVSQAAVMNSGVTVQNLPDIPGARKE